MVWSAKLHFGSVLSLSYTFIQYTHSLFCSLCMQKWYVVHLLNVVLHQHSTQFTLFHNTQSGECM